MCDPAVIQRTLNAAYLILAVAVVAVLYLHPLASRWFNSGPHHHATVGRSLLVAAPLAAFVVVVSAVWHAACST
jgi:hypothetical protein